MNRARAKALVLVNWKGVFYERYLLDSNVTALEGPNGAGKTTVMVAAYVALLPDLAKLRFSNVGETGASGGDKGIWGRLGERARPSYVGLLVQTAEQSAALLGVHLERKSEPSLELSPFLVQGLSPEVVLSELLLEVTEESEEVPTYKALKQKLRNYSSARSEVSVEFFGGVRDYLSALFELGIAPLRLSAEEERGKFNEMLRTSMTGGISRALTSELRNFVFKQEPQLSDTLTRMRSNLSACRRTRTEVAESRKLESEINGIFDAGLGVFRSVYYATLADKEQAENALFDARAKRDELSGELEQLALSIRDENARKAVFDERAETLESELSQARLLAEKLQRASAIAGRLRELVSEREEAEKLALAAELKLARALEHARQVQADRSAAQEQFTRSASALADLQTGLDELHHQARAHRRLAELLEELRGETGDSEFDVDQAPVRLLSLGEELAALDQTRAARSRARQDWTQQSSDYSSALSALEHLEAQVQAQSEDVQSQIGAASGDAPVEGPYARGRLVLGWCEKLESLSQARERLVVEREQLATQATRQAAALDRFQELSAGLELSSEATLDRISLATRIGELEKRILQLENEHRERLWQTQVAVQNERDARAKQQAAEEEQERWQGVVEAASRLERSYGPLEQDTRSVSERVRQIQTTREQAATDLERSVGRMNRCRERADRMEASAGDYPPDLLRLQDELEGALLARRYEQLEPDEARAMQARLGPLLGAVVVTDLNAAIEQVSGKPRELDEIWLLDPAWQLAPGAGHELPASDASGQEQDVVVRFPGGVRISRLPERAVLGRSALEAEVSRLRQEAEWEELEQEKLSAKLRDCDVHLADVAVVRDSISLWLGAGPTLTRQQSETDMRLAQASQEQSRRAASALRESVTQLHTQLDAMREMASLVPWVEGGSNKNRRLELDSELVLADSAAGILERGSAARDQLSELLYCLKSAPPTPEELAAWEAEERTFSEKRDHLFQTRSLLEELVSLRREATFPSAGEVLEERQELVPALEEQAALAKQSAADAEQRVAQAEVETKSLTLTQLKTQAAVLALSAHVERTEGELRAVGLRDYSERAQSRSAELVSALLRDQRVLLEERQGFASAEAVKQERLENAEAALDEAARRLSQATESAAPKLRAWTSLEERRTEAGVLPPQRAMGQERSQWPEVDSRLALLCDRLLAAGATELAEKARASLSLPRPSPSAYLSLWQDVRGWLSRRLPAQVAEVIDPQEALMRLRSDLEGLEQRLTRQEVQLRGNSEDVARSIDVQLRKATAQVRRLNQYLSGVSFGGISAIRVRHGRIEKMTQVLDALRDGSAQKLLFQSNLPIEEALDEVFKRYAGTTGGGRRLLDYREYLEIGVQVQRRGQEAWEAANPSRVSTGEAIGVGAALMMVILTEWERDANLLRQKRPMGSLRFLFLDEANRLSQENLGVLFELCQALELQLLIAAPEVAQAAGNTTYRLVRRAGIDGTDEVFVSGRRSAAASAEPEGLLGSPTVDTEPQLDPDHEVPEAAGELSVAEVEPVEQASLFDGPSV